MTARFIAYPLGEGFEDWCDPSVDGLCDGKDAESAARKLIQRLHEDEGGESCHVIVRAPDGTETRWETQVIVTVEYRVRRAK